jgi:hypothetical protein
MALFFMSRSARAVAAIAVARRAQKGTTGKMWICRSFLAP